MLSDFSRPCKYKKHGGESLWNCKAARHSVMSVCFRCGGTKQRHSIRNSNAVQSHTTLQGCLALHNYYQGPCSPTIEEHLLLSDSSKPSKKVLICLPRNGLLLCSRYSPLLQVAWQPEARNLTSPPLQMKRILWD